MTVTTPAGGTATRSRREEYATDKDRAAYDRGYSRGCNDGLQARVKQWNDGPDAEPYRRGYADGYADGLARNPALPPPE